MTTSNSDGSSTSSTTNYDHSGDPIDQENVAIDVSRNESTQNIKYDVNGNSVVTGYSIDTSDNPSGTKEFDLDGVNTQFYGFDAVTGFTMNLHFTIDFTDQPPNQDDGHHNIFTMKRATPSPWYGFQIRVSDSTPRKLIIGTQFSQGGNSNATFDPASANWIVQNQTAEFNIVVNYDPTLVSNTFVCRETLSNRVFKTSSDTFPDLAELRYLTVCLGCAQDGNGNPYRYAKIDVLDFNIEKIPHPLVAPTMSFSENTITMSCATFGSEIFYRLGTSGEFTKYT